MQRAIPRRQGVGAGVRRPEHRVLDRHPRFVRAEQHRAPNAEIARLREHPRVVGVEQPPRVAGEHIRDVRAPLRHVRFDGVRNGVVPGDRRDVPRLRDGQGRIQDRDAKRRLRIAARHLEMRLAVGDDRVGLRLAPGPGRRRNADRGQQRLDRLAVAAVVAHRAPVGQHEIDPLGAVERAAASDRDDRIDAQGGGERAPGLDHAGVRTRREAAEQPARRAALLERGLRVRSMARRHDARVRHDERPRESELARERAEPCEGAFAEDDARPMVEVERGHH